MTFLETLIASGIRYKRTGDPQEIWMCCPFCAERGEGEDIKFRLGVNIVTGQGHCFNCDWRVGRDAPKLVLGELAIQGGGLEQDTVEAKKQGPVKLPIDFQLLHREDSDPLVRKAQKYMYARRVSKDLLRKHHVGVSLSGRYAYRIVFLIFYEDELKGLVCRDFSGRSPIKYLNSPGEKYLWGLNNVPTAPTVCIAEGIFKALAIERTMSELPEAWRTTRSLAMLGHTLTETMLSQLIEVECKRIILYPDPDRVGIEATVQTAEQLDKRYNVLVCWPPPKSRKQADELSDKSLLTVLQRVVKFSWHLRMTMLAYAAQV